jgi:GTP-binding protein Era
MVMRCQQAIRKTFMISELVREKIIRMLGDELPHDTFVQVELSRMRKNYKDSCCNICGTRQSKADSDR